VGLPVALSLPAILGPMTKVEIENTTANSASSAAGTRQLPQRRCTRSRNGIAATSPIAPNGSEPPVPASRAAPASGPA